MEKFLIISQVVIAALLMIVILAQEKGSGLSATFGGGGEVYRTRRGIDHLLHIVTIVIAVLFVVNSLAFLLLDKTPVSPASTSTNSVAEIPDASVSIPSIDPNSIEFEATPVNE